MRKAVSKDGTICQHSERHLHFKGQWETWVNRLLKPDHLAWKKKSNKAPISAICDLCLNHASQMAQPSREGLGLPALVAGSIGTGTRLSPDHIGSKDCGQTPPSSDGHGITQHWNLCKPSPAILLSSRFPHWSGLPCSDRILILSIHTVRSCGVYRCLCSTDDRRVDFSLR